MHFRKVEVYTLLWLLQYTVLKYTTASPNDINANTLLHFKTENSILRSVTSGYTHSSNINHTFRNSAEDELKEHTTEEQDGEKGDIRRRQVGPNRVKETSSEQIDDGSGKSKGILYNSDIPKRYSRNTLESPNDVSWNSFDNKHLMRSKRRIFKISETSGSFSTRRKRNSWMPKRKRSKFHHTFKVHKRRADRNVVSTSVNPLIVSTSVNSSIVSTSVNPLIETVNRVMQKLEKPVTMTAENQSVPLETVGPAIIKKDIGSKLFDGSGNDLQIESKTEKDKTNNSLTEIHKRSQKYPKLLSAKKSRNSGKKHGRHTHLNQKHTNNVLDKDFRCSDKPKNADKREEDIYLPTPLPSSSEHSEVTVSTIQKAPTESTDINGSSKPSDKMDRSISVSPQYSQNVEKREEELQLSSDVPSSSEHSEVTVSVDGSSSVSPENNSTLKSLNDNQKNQLMKFASDLKTFVWNYIEGQSGLNQTRKTFVFSKILKALPGLIVKHIDEVI